MNTKELWLVSFLLVGMLLLASCGPRPTATAPTPTPTLTPTPTITPTPTPTPIPTLTPAAPTEKPKYGGTINVLQSVDIVGFSPVATAGVGLDTALTGTVFEQYTNADWAKGPAGTGEAFYGGVGGVTALMRWEDQTGFLAESFETPEIGVWILNIRKGVHFALDPKSEASRLLNGREVTADDVVWSINMMNTHPNSSLLRSQPELGKNATVEKTGPWQVTLRTPVEPSVAFVWITGGGMGGSNLYAKEVLEKYGKTTEWQQSVGTGPYMLTDFVPGSAATFTRNPNYWQKNPVGPGKGDQLPYPDGLKILIVPDISTRLAAMRTARADRIDEIEGEDTQSLIKTSPSLRYEKFLPVAMNVAMRTDKKELPFKDVRVRQALMLATDFEAIKNDFYKGQAEIFAFPIAPARGTEHVYLPMEQLPESAKTLFKYNPTRAMQLLAEAGYPNGFKTKIIVQNTSANIDSITIFKAMWAKVGVDLEIQPRETAVYNSIKAGQTHEEMIFLWLSADWTAFPTRFNFAKYRYINASYVNNPPGQDPVIEAAYQEIQKNIMINYPKADQIVRELIPHLVEQAYYISRPTPYSYRLWQPWLKNYYGESTYKYWIPYPWIDQDLKEQMTGRR